MTTGEKIKKARTEKGMSQARLAQMIGVTQQAIAQFESDKNKPKYNTLRKLSSVLQVNLEAFDWDEVLSEEDARDLQYENEEIEQEEYSAFSRFLVSHGANVYTELEDSEDDFINAYISLDGHTYRMTMSKWEKMHGCIYEIAKVVIKNSGLRVDQFDPESGNWKEKRLPGYTRPDNKK